MRVNKVAHGVIRFRKVPKQSPEELSSPRPNIYNRHCRSVPEARQLLEEQFHKESKEIKLILEKLKHIFARYEAEKTPDEKRYELLVEESLCYPRGSIIRTYLEHEASLLLKKMQDRSDVVSRDVTFAEMDEYDW
jgi:hypothetical protein